MRLFIIKHLSFFILIFGLPFVFACAAENAPTVNKSEANKPGIIADSFAYPIGRTEFITEARDNKDEWYNAQDFGENNHLGEDWNKNSGGNTDCGEPVYSIANGVVTYAGDAGFGWGNVVIIEHHLPDGTRVQSLYGHLDKILKTSGEIKKREQIGTIGNANGRYLCHLHLEIRDESCLSWDQVFVGYSPINSGWLDPSDFIDAHRKK